MTVKIRLGALALLVLMAGQAAAAEAASRTEIDRALRVLLADYDVQDHLDIRYAEEVATGFYEVRTGDTLDGIINRAIQGSSIRKEMLRNAFIKANPRAFPSGNPNRMLAGVKLRIPPPTMLCAWCLRSIRRNSKSSAGHAKAGCIFPSE